MLDFRIKDLFFDRPAVQHAVDKAKRATLSKAGAFVRTTARTSIRKRKGTSPPGSPPYSHEGSLRKWILFGYDRSRDSVVVGPVGFNRTDAPHSLEFGGVTVVTRFRRGRRVRQKASVRRRPFMGPALQKEAPRLPRLWAGSVKGT